jgi:pimeloyl-ACP methyl ester carboxylesterase
VRVVIAFPLGLIVALFAGAILLSHIGHDRPWLSVPMHRCAPSLRCGVISVPVGGGLHSRMRIVERPGRKDRPPVFLLAGGPGQPSTEAFALGEDGAELARAFGGRTLVAFDPRGSSGPDALGCDRSMRGSGCWLHPDRLTHFSTRDNADDVDTVRRTLNFDRIAVYGVSYGTQVALTYAAVYKAHLERLVLDSTLPLGRYVGTEPLAPLPSALDQLCDAGDTAARRLLFGCAAILETPGKTLVQVANRLRDDHAAELVSAALETDVAPELGAELPWALAAASHGDFRPLDRLALLRGRVHGAEAEDVNAALGIATRCDDAATGAVSGVRPGTAPFGSWASSLVADLNASCKGWPELPTGRIHTSPADVPLLILSGSRDIRTPTAWAREVAKSFPHATLVVAPGAGHAVLSRYPCGAASVRAWFAGQTPPACPRVDPAVPPVGPFVGQWERIPSVGEAPALTGGDDLTLRAAVQTFREAGAAAALTPPGSTVEGLVSGTLRVGARGGFRLDHYSDYAGLTLTGTFAGSPDAGGLIDSDGRGLFALAGSRASAGSLAMSHEGLRVRFADAVATAR